MEENKKQSFRPPIVTIMGHVDHGKTTLLDAIRKTNVVAKEHGGITQHIGAYQIKFQGKPITFIDTPGHAAFEKMRSRGAEAADIVVLTVAANDGVKPQTVEAIKHIKKANKPLIVAITKTDLPNLNIEKVKSELEKENVVVESHGGKVPAAEVSATKGKGLSELLELVNLIWDLNPQISEKESPLQALTVESFMDKRKGAIVTVIVTKGVLRVGQKIIDDSETITVKALLDDSAKNVKEAFPGDPVEILGFKNVKDVGSIVYDENVTKEKKDNGQASLSEIIAKSQQQKNKFKVLIKADVAGSLEAVLENLPQDILVISSSTGDVTEKDIALAKTASAPIIAFNVKIPNQMQKLSEREAVIIQKYDVIYKLIEEMEGVAQGFEQAKQQAKVIGRGKIIASFMVDGKKIAGTKIAKGKLTVGDEILLVRGENEVGEAKIVSIKKFKKDFKTLSAPEECGIIIEPNLDFLEGDVIESYGP